MIEHIRALVIFAKVAETRSFRGAARALSLSPSVVSQQIATLEGRLGVALIYRSTRALSVTPDGEALLASAHAIVAEAEKGLARFSSVAPSPVGALRITLPEVMSMSPLIERLSAFSAEHPGITLSTAFSDGRLDIIRENYDLAIRVGWLGDTALKAVKIGEISRILVASTAYCESRATPSHPRDLRDWDFIRFDPIEGMPKLRQKGGRAVEARMNSRISASTGIAAYRFAHANAGVALVLSFLARAEIERGEVVRLLPEWQVESAGVYAVWPPNAPRNGLAQRLVNFLREGHGKD